MLSQAVVAAVAAPDSLGTHLVQLAVAGILILQVWIIRVVNDTREANRKIIQWAFGEDGKSNGVNSKVKLFEELKEKRSLQFLAIDNRLDDHNRRLEALEPDGTIHTHRRESDLR